MHSTTNFKTLLKANIKSSFTFVSIFLTIMLSFAPVMLSINLFWQPGDFILRSSGVMFTGWILMRLMSNVNVSLINNDRKRANFLYYRPVEVQTSQIITESIHAFISLVILSIMISISGIALGGVVTGEFILEISFSLVATILVYLLMVNIIDIAVAKYRNNLKRVLQIFVSFALALPFMIVPYLIAYMESFKNFFQNDDVWKWFVPILNVFLIFSADISHYAWVLIPLADLLILIILIAKFGGRRIKSSLSL